MHEPKVQSVTEGGAAAGATALVKEKPLRCGVQGKGFIWKGGLGVIPLHIVIIN